jgi:hypothetical protein
MKSTTTLISVWGAWAPGLSYEPIDAGQGPAPVTEFSASVLGDRSMLKGGPDGKGGSGGGFARQPHLQGFREIAGAEFEPATFGYEAEPGS